MKYRQINNIVKEYPNSYRVIEYHEPYFIPEEIDRHKKEEEKEEKEDQKKKEENIIRSVRRTRSVISDYTLANEFEIFATFTFDPKKVDRFDESQVDKKMQNWLMNQQRKHEKKLKYIVVKEKHKNGAIHFHALMGGYAGQLKKTNVIQGTKRVYNMPEFRYGFTNIQFLDEDKQKTTAYLCKYITKDSDLVMGKKRYWSSRNLTKPTSHTNKAYALGLYPKMNSDSKQFENDFMTIYQIPKTVTKITEVKLLQACCCVTDM